MASSNSFEKMTPWTPCAQKFSEIGNPFYAPGKIFERFSLPLAAS
jgi:hypothetical protein